MKLPEAELRGILLIKIHKNRIILTNKNKPKVKQTTANRSSLVILSLSRKIVVIL